MAARRRSLAVELETKQPAAATAAREAIGGKRGGEGTSMPKHLAMAGEAA